MNSLQEEKSSLLTEELQHRSVPLAFQKETSKSNSRGEDGPVADGVHGRERAADLLNLAHG